MSHEKKLTTELDLVDDDIRELLERRYEGCSFFVGTPSLMQVGRSLRELLSLLRGEAPTSLFIPFGSALELIPSEGGYTIRITKKGNPQ